MPNYAPTTNPGDERRRCRYIGITVPLDERTPADIENGVPAPTPRIDVLEEDVIRTSANAERVLKMLGNLPVGQFDPNETFDVLNPNTDADTGADATVAEAYTLLYSWVRNKQKLRDQAETP